MGLSATTRQPCYFGQAYYDSLSGCPSTSYNDSNNLQPEQNLMSAWYQDLLNKFGKPIDYFVNTYQTSATDSNVYGEQPYRSFYGPKPLRAIIQLNDASVILGTFGYVMDSECTMVVSFIDYERAFANDPIYTTLNDQIEPKKGDRIRLTQFGEDRMGRREGTWYECTSVTDETAQTNQFGGHYVWSINAKKLNPSYETYSTSGEEPKYQDNQVSDGHIGSDLINALGNSTPYVSGSIVPQDIDNIGETKITNTLQNDTKELSKIFGEY